MQVSEKCTEYNRLKNAKPTNGGDLLALADATLSGECTDRNFAEAIKLYKAAIAANNHWAWIALGEAYKVGDARAGIMPDFEKAMSSYEVARAMGIGRGSLLIGALYENGNHRTYSQYEQIEPDFERALFYYKEAIAMGEPRGSTLLGAFYLGGSSGRPRNCEMGLAELERGYQQRELRAAALLGRAYCYGWCGAKDPFKAETYLVMAQWWGDELGTETLKNCPVSQP
jgi:TPR repeat protein